MKNPKALVSLCSTVAAAILVFGCGGGGGGSKASSTTNSTTAGTIYAPNEIVYGIPSSDGSIFSVDEMKPDGTANTPLISNVPTTVSLFAQVPGQNNKFVVAANINGTTPNFGIYLSTGLSVTSPSTLVSPVYLQVNSLAVTADAAHIVYTASLASDPTDTTYLFVESIKGGSPVQYGAADGATVSSADSDTIGFVAPVASTGNDQVYTRSLAAGASGAVTQVTTDTSNHLLPAFNPAGTQLAFWENNGTANTLVVDTLANGTTLNLANPNQLAPLGEAFSADGTELAIAADLSPGGQILTQPITATSVPTVILSNPSVELGDYGLYWTNASGRGLIASLMPAMAKRKSALSYFLHPKRI